MQLSVYKSSAGSGKTFTLVKDFLTLALISDKPELVRNILALTFTNKAAQEMKDRILDSLHAFANGPISGKNLALLESLCASKKLKLSEDEIKKRSEKLLKYILHNYSSFSVSTIDKFNYRLIQTFAQDLGVSSSAEVELDELELLEEAINNLLEESATNDLLAEWLTDFLISQLNEDKSWNIKRHFIDFSKITLNENDQYLIDQLSELELSDFKNILKNIRKRISIIETEAKAIAKTGYDMLRNHDIDSDNYFGGKNSVTIFLRILQESTLEKFPNPAILTMLDKEDWSKGGAPTDQKNKIEASKEETVSTADKPVAGPLADDPIAAEINFDEFAKVDLRVARIIQAAHVEGANKLLQLTLDLGGETRQVFSGIKSSYKPEDLEGRLTVMVANLAPRKMRFGMSEGMVLAAADQKGIYLLEPDSGAQPGQRVS